MSPNIPPRKMIGQLIRIFLAEVSKHEKPFFKIIGMD